MQKVSALPKGSDESNKRTRAMEFDRRQGQLFSNLGVANLARFLQGHALDALGHIRGRSDR